MPTLQANAFLCFTLLEVIGGYWWIIQMCMALAALFSIVVAASMAYKIMVKHEPLDVMKLFKPLVISIILCWWYPPSDTGMTKSGSSWCFLDFLSYIPNCIGSYTHDLYEAESTQIEDKFEEVQGLIYVRDTMYTALQAQADVAHSGTSDPNLVEATMEQAGVDEVTSMEKDASRLWFTSLTAGAVVGLDKLVMLLALVVFRIGWWATIYCQQILLGMLTIFGPIQWAFSLLPKWESSWAKWLTRYLTVHFYGAMLYFVRFSFSVIHCISTLFCRIKGVVQQICNKNAPIIIATNQRYRICYFDYAKILKIIEIPFILFYYFFRDTIKALGNVLTTIWRKIASVSNITNHFSYNLLSQIVFEYDYY